MLKDGKAYLQAGGGLVACSTPLGEYNESVNKAKAGLEGPRHGKAVLDTFRERRHTSHKTPVILSEGEPIDARKRKTLA